MEAIEKNQSKMLSLLESMQPKKSDKSHCSKKQSTVEETLEASSSAESLSSSSSSEEELEMSRKMKHKKKKSAGNG